MFPFFRTKGVICILIYVMIYAENDSLISKVTLFCGYIDWSISRTVSFIFVISRLL